MDQRTTVDDRAWDEATAATRRRVDEGEDVRFSLQLAGLLLAVLVAVLSVLVVAGEPAGVVGVVQVVVTVGAVVLGVVDWVGSRRRRTLLPFLGMFLGSLLRPLSPEQRRSLTRCLRGREPDPGPAAPLVLAQLDLARRRDRATIRTLVVMGLAVLGAGLGSGWPHLVGVLVAALVVTAGTRLERSWRRRARERAEAAVARSA